MSLRSFGSCLIKGEMTPLLIMTSSNYFIVVCLFLFGFELFSHQIMIIIDQILYWPVQLIQLHQHLQTCYYLELQII
jgi:hypothetical protein